ncbi:hypothetical protein LJK87_14290 [Paenibacillus sp. P25]|nr:hypothetical protein LJK87_14290 [Paenibacillus sp. P25]
MSAQSEGVLAIGSGPFLISLAEAWLESGWSKMTLFVTNPLLTDTEELKKLREQAHQGSSEASLAILNGAGDEEVDWEAVVRPFPFILYVSQHGDWEELRNVQTACIAAKKPMIPATGLRGMGIAGPWLNPDGEGRWESAWRRVHTSVFPREGETEALSGTAAAILSNLLVYEWKKAYTGNREPHSKNQCYILDPATLTGSWHPILPHPLVSGYDKAREVTHLELELADDREPVKKEEWFTAFGRLTSKVSGIFHMWEEGELNQLPLAQCLVQPADPLSKGPAGLLPAVVCSGLTHEEARRESGLAGLEAYVHRLSPLFVTGTPYSTGRKPALERDARPPKRSDGAACLFKPKAGPADSSPRGGCHTYGIQPNRRYPPPLLS